MCACATSVAINHHPTPVPPSFSGKLLVSQHGLFQLRQLFVVLFTARHRPECNVLQKRELTVLSAASCPSAYFDDLQRCHVPERATFREQQSRNGGRGRSMPRLSTRGPSQLQRLLRLRTTSTTTGDSSSAKDVRNCQRPIGLPNRRRRRA